MMRARELSLTTARASPQAAKSSKAIPTGPRGSTGGAGSSHKLDESEDRRRSDGGGRNPQDQEKRGEQRDERGRNGGRPSNGANGKSSSDVKSASASALDRPLPEGWEMTMSQTHQRPFYHHPASGATSWTRPESPASPPTSTSATTATAASAATERRIEDSKAKDAPASSKPPTGPKSTSRPLTESRAPEQRDERRPPTGPRGPGSGPSNAGPGRDRDDRRFRDDRPRDDRTRDVRQEPRRRSPSPRRDEAKRPRVDDGGRRSPGPANRTFSPLPHRTTAAASIPDLPASGRAILVS